MSGVRRGMVAGLVLLTLLVVAPLAVRWLTRAPADEPAVTVVDARGEERRVGLREMKRLPAHERQGEAQNQYGNWRDGGVYTGALLLDILGTGPYETVEAVAEDGYRVTIERARVEDEDYPMVLAYARDGAAVPAWEDGFRLVVLPEDGRVSNEEYQADSAGSFWVKNVARLILHAPRPDDES